MIRLALTVFVAALAGAYLAVSAHDTAMRLPLVSSRLASPTPHPTATPAVELIPLDRWVHMPPAKGRLHVGSRLYVWQHLSGEVIEFTQADPTTGLPEPGLKTSLDGKVEYWPLSTINEAPPGDIRTDK